MSVSAGLRLEIALGDLEETFLQGKRFERLLFGEQPEEGIPGLFNKDTYNVRKCRSMGQFQVLAGNISSVYSAVGLRPDPRGRVCLRPGVDVSAGETRTVTSARRKQRIQKVLKRKARLRVPTRRAGSLAQRIYKCGLHPAAMYGEVHAAPGLGGTQPADGRQIPLCVVAMVRKPDDVLGHSAHFEVEQRGVARSHAPARRDWRARPVLESPQPSCLAKSLGAGQIATTKSLAKCERPRWCNISESGQDSVDLALPFPVFDDNNTEIMLTTTYLLCSNPC